MLDNIDKIMRNNKRNPVFILNNNGEFIDINDNFCQKLGCTKERILGKTIEETSFLTDHSRKQLIHRRDSNLIGKETAIHCFDVVTQEGDVLSIEIDTVPFLKDGVVSGEMGIVKKTTIGPSDKSETKIPSGEKINEIQAELSRRQADIESMNAELETRNAIISEIKKQLTDKQVGLAEKTGFVDKLQTEIQQQQQELHLKNEELGVAKLEIDKTTKETNQIRTELENKNRELLDKNVEINQLKNNLEDMTEEVTASKSALRWFQIELEKKQEELQSMNTELDTRNIIIAEIKKQLTEKQTNVVDKTKGFSELQIELERKQEEIDALNTRLQGFNLADSGRIAGDLTSLRTEIGRIDGVLKEKQKEVETLDRSIDLKTRELDDLNMKIQENFSALKLAESELGRKQKEIVVEETQKEIPPGEILRDKLEVLRDRLKIYDEIDRGLDGAASGDIKTKKIEEDLEDV